MKLYKITLKNCDKYYVIDEDETSAYEELKAILVNNNFYFEDWMKLKCIELIAENFYEENVFVEND